MRARLTVILWLSALAVNGQGTIRYVDLGGVQFSSEESGSVTSQYGRDNLMDFDGNGTSDIIVRTRTPREQFVVPADGNAVLGYRNPPPDLSSYVMPQAFGVGIGPNSLAPIEWIGAMPNPVSSLGPIGPILGSCIGTDTGIACGGAFYGQTAYMGIQFQIEGQTHYGWMHLRNRGAASDVYGYAYNTVPGQPIFAGQVPEPGIIALLVPGGGFLYWWLRRIR